MRFPVSFLALALAGSSLAATNSSPVVRMLVPGFTVQELPVQLPNINNLRFAADGRLFALGYDGRIYVLRDTDGDGLEDQATVFWDKSTLSVPVGMALAPEGVYVSSHGKVSLLRDTDGDGRADREEVIAQGWPPTDVASGGVDATGVTLDKAGNIYFGLIAADYSNPYRVQKGVTRYELNGPRGTIQKLSRHRGSLETVATGIRVPFALAFNRAGDLFCTDQEGETWCPNGNPLDELNHIIAGRNYGFPPRHEKWLPKLVSEAPVVAFGPQHQSTCGLIFNEPKSGQGLFGPDWWEGDAFIAGESRGKIWRVHLVKTPAGYIGKEFTIARLSMLTIDLTISPKGALYVCCHSGQPDWGTGPKGEGKLFKISYTDRKAPQPVFAWAPQATEVRVAFDKAVDPAVAGALAGRTAEFGEYVRAADRFEVLKPPYKVVARQDATPRGRLKIVAARMEGPRTLVLRTDPHPQAVTYALTIPGLRAAGTPGPGMDVDLDYDLSGRLSLTQQTDLTRGWPHRRELLAGLEHSQSFLGDVHPAPYPFIHPVVSEDAPPLVLAGADFERGRSLFFDQKLKCSTCHRIRGEGAQIGPDLTDLSAKDPASVLHDIREPSASINPDYVAYNVQLKNGEELTGFLRAQNERALRLVGADGKERVFPSDRVASARPSAVSLMPSGLLDGLNEKQVNDLLVFLLNAPPVRSAAEVPAALSAAPGDGEHGALNLVLVASPQDHGAGQHDYPAWQKQWHEWLGTRARVADAWLWPTVEQFQTANVLVFYYWNRAWDSMKLGQLDDFLARGGGLVVLHSATIGDPDPEALAERIGLASDSHKTKYRHTPIDLNIVAAPDQLLMRGVPSKLHFLDEPYWPMFGDTNRVSVLATAEVDGAAWPIIWTYEKGRGRVFASIFGHYTWTWNDPWFKLIIARGISWAGGHDPSRLDGKLSAKP